MVTESDNSYDELFHEVQRFSLVLRLVVLATMVTAIGLGYIAIIGAALPPPHIIGAVVVTIVPIAITVLLIMAKLETIVRSDGFYVRLFPLHLRFRKFTAEQIQSHYARKYRPILEYGGWGIRYTFSDKGKAYNARGNLGVQLELSTGSRLLIGSQKPEELNQALDTIAVRHPLAEIRTSGKGT